LGKDFNAADYWHKQSKGRINARYISPSAIILWNAVTKKYPEILDNTWIGHFCIIDGSAGLFIGDGVEISCGAHIYTHDTHKRCTLGYAKLVCGVVIGNHVFVGPNSVVSYGCIMEENSMLAPLSFLKPETHVFKYELWGGIPAKRLGDLRKMKHP
jgi:carbonic anhydrase/acetyltransferase-like protein (isoleucine patch superfamily)